MSPSAWALPVCTRPHTSPSMLIAAADAALYQAKAAGRNMYFPQDFCFLKRGFIDTAGVRSQESPVNPTGITGEGYSRMLFAVSLHPFGKSHEHSLSTFLVPSNENSLFEARRLFSSASR
jgi:hypothetical protein